MYHTKSIQLNINFFFPRDKCCVHDEKLYPVGSVMKILESEDDGSKV